MPNSMLEDLSKGLVSGEPLENPGSLWLERKNPLLCSGFYARVARPAPDWFAGKTWASLRVAHHPASRSAFLRMPPGLVRAHHYWGAGFAPRYSFTLHYTNPMLISLALCARLIAPECDCPIKALVPFSKIMKHRAILFHCVDNFLTSVVFALQRLVIVATYQLH